MRACIIRNSAFQEIAETLAKVYNPIKAYRWATVLDSTPRWH